MNSEVISFAPRQKIACVNITIVDDTMMESVNEYFTVSLERYNNDSQLLIVSNQPSSCTIRDNDSTLVNSNVRVVYYFHAPPSPLPPCRGDHQYGEKDI